MTFRQSGPAGFEISGNGAIFPQKILHSRRLYMEIPFCTNYLWLNIIIFAIGSYILIKGSDIFVDAAAAIARYWNVSELIIGLTLVSIGTSLPELATSLIAQGTGDSDFVIGNIAGSNVTNITLILGAAIAVGGAMPFEKKLFTRDTLMMNALFLITVAAFFVLPKVPGRTGTEVFGLNWIAGLVLLIGAFVYSWWLFRNGGESEDEAATEKCSLLKEFALLFLGLVMIVAGSKGMVDTVQKGAYDLGISTIIISATIVAFGTSVPELAVTIAGVLKGKNDMAIGNIVGSCIYNILLIFGASALLKPLGINSGMTGLWNLALIIPAGVMLLFAMGLFYRKQLIPRAAGFLMLAAYLAFLGFNVWKGFHG